MTIRLPIFLLIMFRYDAQSCEKLIAEKTLAETEALAAKDAQISELTAKSVHLEQVESDLCM